MSLIETLNSLGGAESSSQQQETNEVPYYDKIDHVLRSVTHQDNHIRHLKRIMGPNCGKGNVEEKARLVENWFRNHRPIFRSRNQK